MFELHEVFCKHWDILTQYFQYYIKIKGFILYHIDDQTADIYFLRVKVKLMYFQVQEAHPWSFTQTICLFPLMSCQHHEYATD